MITCPPPSNFYFYQLVINVCLLFVWFYSLYSTLYYIGQSIKPVFTRHKPLFISKPVTGFCVLPHIYMMWGTAEPGFDLSVESIITETNLTSLQLKRLKNISNSQHLYYIWTSQQQLLVTILNQSSTVDWVANFKLRCTCKHNCSKKCKWSSLFLPQKKNTFNPGMLLGKWKFLK